jgi:hypothetical protein
VSDFFTELRREVVDAHGRASLRRTRWRLPQVRPAAAFAAALAVAVAFGLLVVVSVLVRSSPQIAHPRIVAVVHLGGDPLDAKFAAGSVWVTETSGDVLRIDPASHRVLARIRLSGGADWLSADRSGVWATDGQTQVIRIDVRTNEVADRYRRPALRPVPSGGGIWYVRHTGAAVLERLDPVSGRLTARLKLVPAALSAAGDALWSQEADGTITEIDGARGRIVHQFPRVAPNGGGDEQKNGLAADERGVWASSAITGELVRVGPSGVVERVRVGDAPTAVAEFDDAVWVVTGDALHGGIWVSRVDPGSGRVVARIAFGAVRPVALVAAGRELWAICTDGTARVIRPW